MNFLRLFIFIRSIDNECNIIEELVSLVPLKARKKLTDLYDAATKTLIKFSLNLTNISGIDGAPDIVGKKEGFVKWIENSAITFKNLNLMKDQCILHQEHLRARSLKQKI